MEKGGCVNKQTDSEGNILILSSISSSEDQRRAEDSLESEDGLASQPNKSNQSGREETETSSIRQSPSLVTGEPSRSV